MQSNAWKHKQLEREGRLCTPMLKKWPQGLTTLNLDPPSNLQVLCKQWHDLKALSDEKYDGLLEDLEEKIPYSELEALRSQLDSAADDFTPVELDERWYPLRPHAGQQNFFFSKHRFNVVPAGRRSGKTEVGKRRLVRRAISETQFTDAWFIAGAPTYNQAKRIFWKDIKRLSPADLVEEISESALTIRYVNGAEISVVGMDTPERIEGRSINGALLDEYANMRSKVWTAHLRPALADRLGWCDFTGVPEGRNHYYDLYNKALADTTGEWAAHSWPSSDILPAAEVESARLVMDELTFKQEYEASFVTFTGRAYYPYADESHLRKLEYQPGQDVILCFDFNVSPGVCAVIQEQAIGTCVIGEIYIESNSNTERICDIIGSRWSHHKGRFLLYGDATGGAQGSAKVAGSDWDIIKRAFKHYFGDRFEIRVPKANPRERARVNAVNTRLRRGDGVVQMFIDPGKAPNVMRDFEGVRVSPDGSLDKKSDPRLTHISDAVGYYIARRFPAGGSTALSNNEI